MALIDKAMGPTGALEKTKENEKQIGPFCITFIHTI